MTDPEDRILCCPPDCCDMRGFLTFQIMWELSKGPLNGQQIAERLAKRRGTKPTPGTIYPALKALDEGGQISGTKDGREIVYTLTEAGKIALTDASRYFYQVFGDITEDSKVIAVRMGDCDC
ncbi:MAG: PadR family transcriptional regulator [Candidatus Thorarchaeota archaeon]